MNDTRLKPRLLRSLLRDYLPDEKQPFPSSSELSSVLSQVKIHRLLSPPDPNVETNPKHMIEWESAIDEWVDRLISLISSNMPDKCWAGICLLGVTCECCNSDRFLTSYSLWFQKLLSCIQLSSSTHFVKVASCASLADLFTRLANFSNVKKDATTLAGKLTQPILQLLNEDGAAFLWEGALNLLWTIITLFPFCVHRHYNSVEAALVSRIKSAKNNSNMSKKLASCLALLPKVKDDGDSWSLLMQKILYSIDVLLADAFQGLEEEAKSSEVMRLIVPPGKDPPLLGDQSILEGPEEAEKKLREVLAPRVSTLMHCCCIMLNAYPVQVIVPVHHLLALVKRVLLIDGSLDRSLIPFTTPLQQEILCAELPTLHLASLDLLIAVIKGVRSQLLPHAINIARIVTKYFRRATLPSIRIKVYYILQTLLISMGVGMAVPLAQEVIEGASADLIGCPAAGPVSSCMHLPYDSSESFQQSHHRKRKHASGSPIEQPNGVKFGAEALSRNMSPLSVKVAALKALESLVTVGGSLGSGSLRSNVDSLLINVAINACKGGWARKGKCLDLTEDSPVSQADFQFAALEALLASLLSAVARPPYLSQGLNLFRRGKQETGTKLAELCARALLALEVLIHPRYLPLIDASVAARISELDDEGPSSSKHQRQPYSSMNHQQTTSTPFYMDDDLYYALRDDDADDNVPGMDNSTNNMTTEHVERYSVVEKNLVTEQLKGHAATVEEKALLCAADIEMAVAVCSAEEAADVVKHDSQPSSVSVAEDDSAADVRFNSSSSSSRGLGLDTSTNLALEGGGEMMERGKGADTGYSYGNLAVSAKDKLQSYDSDDSTSIDSLPPIVDAPPDSDSD